MKINTVSTLIILIFFSFYVSADIKIEDDTGQVFIFKKPIERIISLAPHITESLFAAGARSQVIATVTYSDYPEQAKRVPVIGDHSKYDFETIIKLKPELILAWKSGNPVDQVQQLRDLGFKVFINDPHTLEDVAKNLKTMGRLMSTESVANARATEYLTKLKQLEVNFKNTKQLDVFYQVWDEPLITINKMHIINDVIELCGGKNVFAELSFLAPRVSIEAVIIENPDVIVAGMAEGREGWLQNWRQWEDIAAVKQNHLFAIHADLITRHTPRILLGVEKMCTYLDKVRKNL